MRVLADVNIILDVLCNRQPFAVDAQALWTRVEAGKLRASLCATTLPTIYYLLRKQLRNPAARQAVADILTTFEICPVDEAVLRAALVRAMPDYEDAVQDAAAEQAGIDVIVTRNPKDFASSTRRIVDAPTLVKEVDAMPTGTGPSPPTP